MTGKKELSMFAMVKNFFEIFTSEIEIAAQRFKKHRFT